MTEQQQQALVAAVLAKLRQPVLVVIQAASGYRQEIVSRLAAQRQTAWEIALAPDAALTQQDGELTAMGPVVDPARLAEPAAMDGYRGVLLPFLDSVTAAHLANGCLRHPLDGVVHHALMMGKPVLALRCHCDLNSEINQLRGLGNNPAMSRLAGQTLAQLEAMGMQFGPLDALLQALQPSAIRPVAAAPPAATEGGFITLRAIQRDPSLAQSTAGRLTDAAADYLKSLSR